MKTYGLIGYPLSHSASASYFNTKFKAEAIDAEYKLFPIPAIEELNLLLKTEPTLVGFNVTCPYKEQVIKALDKTDSEAELIGAVNTVTIRERLFRSKELCGYNTDYIAFEQSLLNMENLTFKKMLILGYGGAAKAVERVCRRLNIDYDIVSRNPIQKSIKSYDEITEKNFGTYNIIVNATPLGMYPNTQGSPTLPYHAISPDQLFYDLIYNPEKTEFLLKAEKHGARIKNGLEMLLIQAEAAWKIWND